MESMRLYVIIALSGMMFGSEIVASHVTQSLALLISAYHMLYNILSLLLLVISHRMSRGRTLKNTFGWARIKVLGMLVNMLFLCALCFAASVEAVQTMVHASHENTEPQFPFLLMILGILNFTLNLVCFLLIGGYTHHQGCSMIVQGSEIQVNYVLAENEVQQTICEGTEMLQKKVRLRGEEEEPRTASVSSDHKLLDISRDTSSCLTVIACACVVLLLDGMILKYADPILAMASVAVLMATTYPFIRESGLILLQSIPNHMDIDSLSNRLRKEFPAIKNVHDLHVWRLTASEVIATVHVILSSVDVYSSISSQLSTFFEKEGISLVTIQPEFQKTTWPVKDNECILQCSSNNNCGAFTCCGPLEERQKSCVRFRCEELVLSDDCKSGNPDHFQKNDVEFPFLGEYDFSMIRTAAETTV